MQSSQEIKKRIRRKRRKKRILRLLLVLLAALAAAAGTVFVLPRRMQDGQETEQTPAYTAVKAYTGDIERLVYGSGSVQPISHGTTKEKPYHFFFVWYPMRFIRPPP